MASALLVATLLTTSVISGVFAKYTTKAEGNDTARVAKWGVVAKLEGSLFGPEYADAAGGNTVDTSGKTISVSSKMGRDSSDAGYGENLVAPGTKSKDGAFTCTVTGTPEVAGVIDIKAKGKNISLAKGTYARMTFVGKITKDEYDAGGEYYYDYKRDNDPNKEKAGYRKATSWEASKEYYQAEEICTLDTDYYPVVFNLSSTSNTVSSDSLAAIIGQLNTAASFAPGDTLDTKVPQISWEWKFCNSSPACGGYSTETGSGASACVYCIADTILGDVMAGHDPYIYTSGTNTDGGGPYYPMASNKSITNLSLDINMAVRQVD